MTSAIPISKQPDILEVIADLSNDEVFTPPRIASAALDLLPPEVWHDPNLRWLDPACKTGVFLREITRRLLGGLRDQFPDEEACLDHILREMVFGIGITELTALMARRTLYCAKDAAGDQSAVKMPTPAGNVWFDGVEHGYNAKGRCRECGATREEIERENRENYAYAFIHQDGLAKLKQDMSMKFDVIVGNPPYQMQSDGGTRDMPLYHYFIEQAKALSPKYIAMIMPSRWMAGGLGLSQFRAEMLADRRLKSLTDFPVASEVFPGVEVKGGVCYFLWDSSYEGPCSVSVVRGENTHGPFDRDLNEYDVFVRDGRALDILKKVTEAGEPPMSAIVSARTAFGLYSNYPGHRKSARQGDVRFYAASPKGRFTAWVPRSAATTNADAIDMWKAMIPKAGSDGGQRLPDLVLGQPWIAEPPSVCTQSFLFVCVHSEKEAESVTEYFRTRFLRFLVSLRKITQDTTRDSYLWVPQQTWDRTWTDDELYAKYNITPEEQSYISEMVREMPA